MSTPLQDATAVVSANLADMEKKIDALDVPEYFKGAFMGVTDIRGFRVSEDNLSRMQTIGETKSETLLHLCSGKSYGLVVPFRLATQLKTEKCRAMAVQWVDEQQVKMNGENILLAILSVKGNC